METFELVHPEPLCLRNLLSRLDDALDGPYGGIVREFLRLEDGDVHVLQSLKERLSAGGNADIRR